MAAARGRTRRAALAIGALLACGLAACGGTSSGRTEVTVDPLTVTVPASTIPADTPVEPGVFQLVGATSTTYDLVRSGAALGEFAREGLAVRIRDVASDEAAATALRAGEADGAVLPVHVAFTLASSGTPVRIVLLLTSPTSAEQIVARSGIDDVAGLVGARVAHERAGDGELLLRAALAAAEVPATGVSFAASADPGALVLDGAADAAVVSAARAADLAAADPAIHPIATAGDQPGLLARALVVREDVVADLPGQVLAFVRAWQDVYLVERDDPEAMAALIAGRTHEPVADVAAALVGLGLYDVPANAVELLPGGEFYDRTARAIGAAATASGRLESPVDETTLIDGAFVQSVASAL